MAYYVMVLVKDDPDPVFDWVIDNIPAGEIIRQKARPVLYEAVRTRATHAVDPDFNGWLVKVVVRSCDSAERIVEAWKSRAGHCHAFDFDAALARNRSDKSAPWRRRSRTTKQGRLSIPVLGIAAFAVGVIYLIVYHLIR